MKKVCILLVVCLLITSLVGCGDTGVVETEQATNALIESASVETPPMQTQDQVIGSEPVEEPTDIMPYDMICIDTVELDNGMLRSTYAIQLYELGWEFTNWSRQLKYYSKSTGELLLDKEIEESVVDKFVQQLRIVIDFHELEHEPHTYVTPRFDYATLIVMFDHTADFDPLDLEIMCDFSKRSDSFLADTYDGVVFSVSADTSKLRLSDSWTHSSVLYEEAGYYYIVENAARLGKIGSDYKQYFFTVYSLNGGDGYAFFERNFSNFAIQTYETGDILPVDVASFDLSVDTEHTDDYIYTTECMVMFASDNGKNEFRPQDGDGYLLSLKFGSSMFIY